MRRADWLRLLLLGAIWGASFIFLRVLAPRLGTVTTAELRVGIGGLAFLPYFAVKHFHPRLRAHWKHYIVAGLFNIAAPMTLFSYAAVHIPASYSVIINSSTPLFGTILSAPFLNERLSARSVAGLVLGMCGVALVTRGDAGTHGSSQFWASIAACLVAAICYALSGVYMKRFAPGVDPLGTAGCSQLLAGLVLFPIWVTNIPHVEITGKIIVNVLALAILCTTFGFVLYFRLISDVGPARAMTVALLTPIFGVLWGSLFLHEALTLPVVGGCLLVIGSAAMVLLKTTRPPGNDRKPEYAEERQTTY
jgi:drug/metabolite transporter (DMT)-like permease